jgi:sugar-specific transcriptional regulator TrmB
MSEQTKNIQTLLKPFGLNEDESTVYILLLKQGPSTAVQLSRELKIGRTKVYRIIEALSTKKLATEIPWKTGKRFTATSPEHLGLLLKEREFEVENLRKSMPKLIGDLTTLQSKESTTSQVLEYKGIEGLKQVTWNSLRAKDVLRIYEISTDMSAFIDKKFSEKIRLEFLLRKTKIKQLTNIKHFEPFTKLQQFIDECCELRYIDPKKLELNFEIMTYNNVLSMYTFKYSQFFCVEIYNEDLAKMQKQLFDNMWETSQVMRYGKSGEADIIRKD